MRCPRGHLCTDFFSLQYVSRTLDRAWRRLYRGRGRLGQGIGHSARGLDTIKKLNEKSRELNLEVIECSEEVAEVTALGGSGFMFVVNLAERVCSCRQW